MTVIAAAIAGCGGGGSSGSSNTPLPNPAPVVKPITVFAGSVTDAGVTDGAGTNARFGSSGGLAIDGSGNVYMTDRGNNLLRKITPAGVVTTVAGGGANRDPGETNPAKANLDQPLGVAVDASGAVYFSLGREVRRLTPQGGLSNVFTLPEPIGDSRLGPASYATGLALDSAGNLYVANTVGTRKVTSAGVSTLLEGVDNLTGIGTRVSRIRGLAVDTDGTLYGRTLDYTISKLTSTGPKLIAGISNTSGVTDGSGASASIEAAGFIAVDSKGNVYLAEQLSNLIRKVTPAGVVSTVAGTRNATTVNIDALPGVLPQLGGIAIDAADVLYVSAGNAILKIQLP